MKPEKNIQSKYNRLKKKHKLSFSDKTTYQEKWSFNISSLNLISLLTFYSLVLIFIVVTIIKFTPLKKVFIQEANLFELNQKITNNNQVIDSLENAIKSNNLFVNNIKSILKNEDKLDTNDIKHNALPQDYKPSFEDISADSILINHSTSNTISNNNVKNITSLAFYLPPIQGLVSKSFNYKTKHYGVDIVGKKNEIIKATLKGIVIFSNWTDNQGHVVIIQHKNNLLSVYLHNSSLLKNVGQKVNAGDPIAIIGNSGEYTDGPHLHFEIWQNGIPLNPQDFISF